MALNWHTVEVVLFELCGVDTVPLNMTGHSTFLFSKQREHVFALKRLYARERGEPCHVNKRTGLTAIVVRLQNVQFPRFLFKRASRYMNQVVAPLRRKTRKISMKSSIQWGETQES